MATPIADMVEQMLSTGIPPEMIVLAVRTAELAQPVADQTAERRRQWDRERKRRKLSTGIPLAVSLPSTTTNNLTVSQKERSEIGALAREFAETFWPAYPHKVAKPAALKAFSKARKRASLETIMAGLERYANKTDDRHWANGATWLNNDRWEDQPGPAQEGNGNGRRGQPAPKDDPKSIRGAFDRLFARLDGGDEFGEPSRQTNLRVIPGGSGQ